ncbi:hypothetical protein AA0323_1452 [Asaia siamensis NRIC 0323]|nr:hypothetical protein AA0323_1452 [Asaia siamensis NRIC 0323]
MSSVTVSIATPPDFLQGTSTDYSAGATKEGCVPEIIPVLDQAIEKIAFRWHEGAVGKIALKRIGRIEMMRCLYQRETLIGHEWTHGLDKKVTLGYVIAVKNRNEIALGQGHRMIEIARLCVRML